MSRRRVIRRPTCHPDRPHAGRGLCSWCYADVRDHVVMTPQAVAVRARRRAFSDPLDRQVPAEIPLKPKLPGCFLTSIPARCPKCDNPVLARDGRLIHCPLCGADRYLVRERSTP